ncbi:MAG: hypothetical protein AAFQ79_07615 [Pseudomonadota bacterium]
MSFLPPLLMLLSACTMPLQADEAIPRLAPGPHMGFIEGFDDLRPGADGINRMQIANRLRAEAVAAGMSIARAQVDWRDLEIAPGVYDQDQLDETMAWPGRDGLPLFVTLSTIDISELTLPDYLTGPNGMARDGLKLDGPEITTRFHAFLDWFVPQLEGYNVWGLALGNEVDGLVSDALLPQSEVLNHLRNAMTHSQTLDPDLAVTVTLTGGANLNVPRFTNRLVDAMDIVSFNTYCLSGSLQVTGPDTWESTLKRWKRVAGDREIFIQELGCPVGHGQTGGEHFANAERRILGSEALQSDFIEFHMRAFTDDPQLRAATVFQLFDWSPELADVFKAPFDAAGEPIVGELLEEWLATVGLCRWSDATCRPAWETFLTGLGTLQSVRGE